MATSAFGLLLVVGVLVVVAIAGLVLMFALRKQQDPGVAARGQSIATPPAPAAVPPAPSPASVRNCTSAILGVAADQIPSLCEHGESLSSALAGVALDRGARILFRKACLVVEEIEPCGPSTVDQKTVIRIRSAEVIASLCCPKCGTEQDRATRFCGDCGAPLGVIVLSEK
ncbi:MAG: hypothetical protein AB1714_10070 [Acidobacteriota bacterium]